MDKPRRAWRIELHAEADSRAELVELLKSMLFDSLEPGGNSSVSGGYSSGGYYTVTHDPEQTHDKYFEQLEAYQQFRRDNGCDASNVPDDFH